MKTASLHGKKFFVTSEEKNTVQKQWREREDREGLSEKQV